MSDHLQNTKAQPSSDFGTKSNDLIELGQLWSAIRRKSGFILGVAVSVGCLVLVYTFMSGMRFRASGQLYLGEIDHSTRVSQDAPTGLDLSSGSQQQVASEIEILQSRSLVRRAVQETGLNVSISAANQSAPSYLQWRLSGRNLDLIDGVLDYVRATDTTLAASIRKPQAYRAHFLSSSEYELRSGVAPLARGKLGQPLHAGGLDLTLTRGALGEPKPGSEYDLVIRPLDRVVDGTMRLLKVSAPRESAGGSSINVVTLEFSNPSPRLSAEFLQKLMLAYLNERQSWKTEDAGAAETFIKNELKNVRESLDQLQTKLADYRKHNGSVVLDDQAKAMIEQVGKYEEQRAAARLQVAAFADIKNGLKSPDSPMGAYLVGEAGDKVMENMAESLSQAREKLTDLETRFQGAAPEVREQRSRVNAQLDSIRNYISSRQKRAQSNLGALNGIIGQFEQRLQTVPAAELGLAQLSRESEVYSRTYSYLLERQQQARILKASTLSKNRILDAPEVPLWEDSPSLPLRLASLFIGLILGAAFVVVRSLLADKFQSQVEVCRSLGSVPVLGTIPQIPKNRKDPNRNLIAEYPNSRFAEAFRTLRIKLYAWAGEDCGKVFVITSPVSADGKTTCLRSLAVALCADGKSVLVVDADVRRSVLRSSATDLPMPGLTDVLKGQCDWHAALSQVPHSAQYHLSSGSLGRPELLTTGAMRRFLIEARTTFDFILIDCPAFPLASEALTLTPMVDGTISIIRLFNTPKKLASEHLDQVSSYARQYGVIINDVEIEAGLNGTGANIEVPTQTTEFPSLPEAQCPAGNLAGLRRMGAAGQSKDDVTLPIALSNTTVEQQSAHALPGKAPRRLLIVIPTFNEASHIEAVVEQLASEMLESVQTSIVVVDGGSTDGTQGIVTSLMQRHLALYLVHNEMRIQSAAVNLAVRQFGREAEILIRCDAHATYPARYCQQLIESIERTGADSVVVPMDSVGHSPLQRAIAWVSNSIVGTGGSAHRAGRQSGFVDHGHHAAFRVDTFRRVGGYDESFTHNEDSEFDCRQRAHGAKIYLDADIRVQYRPRPSWRALASQYYRYGAGRSRTLRRHPGSLRLRQLLVPLNLVVSALAIGFSPWCLSLLLWPASYMAALGATSVSITLRQRSIAGLLAGPAAGLMHTTWAAGLLKGLLGGRDRKWQPQQAMPLWAPTPGNIE